MRPRTPGTDTREESPSGDTPRTDLLARHPIPLAGALALATFAALSATLAPLWLPLGYLAHGL